MNFVNLTPHAINVTTDLGPLEYPASGQVARVNSTHESSANGAPHVPALFMVEYGQVTGLPDPVPGTLLIVSALVASAAKNRLDLVSPASGHPDVVRVDGQIKSVPGLLVNHYFQWKSDTELADCLSFNDAEREAFDCLPNHCTAQQRLDIMTTCLGKLRPESEFHILDCRDMNNSDELQWCIAMK